MPSKVTKVDAPAKRWGRIEEAAEQLIYAANQKRDKRVEYVPVPLTAVNRLIDALNIKVTPWQ